MKRRIAWILLGIMMMGTAACSASAETVAAAPKAQTGTAAVGDMQMDYAVFGTGSRTLVILPGLAIHSVMSAADAVASAYQEFTGEYTVYVFERASRISDGYSVRDMARDTALAMQSLGIEKADIFGASMGGMIAQYMAIDYPQMVSKLILGSTQSRANAAAAQVLEGWIALAEKRDEQALLASFADSVYSQATLAVYREMLITSNAGITEDEYNRFIILANACRQFDCYEELSKIQCPVLVLGSEGDRVLTADASREIAEALNCEIYIYPDTYGHAVYDEAADYKDRMLTFLN
jgi:3-oxoadipate enol-lactonase